MPEKDAPTALRVWLARNPDVCAKGLAAQLGCFRQRISEWCMGKATPNVDARFALEDITGGFVSARSWSRQKPDVAADRAA
jgi:hypothetical protein